MAITLQTYFWFSNIIGKKPGKGNVYTGSTGTDEEKGCMRATLFEYTVWEERVARPTEEDEKNTELLFFVESRYALPFKSGIGKEKVGYEKKTFPGCEESLAEIRAYLEKRESEVGRAEEMKNETE